MSTERHGRGAKNPNWRGGRIVERGRPLLRMPEHPAARKNGYVYEYRVIAERALGRLLPDGAVVHHVNGDHTDNRPRNLVICEDQGYHQTLHARTRARHESGNANHVNCCFCGRYDDPAVLTIRARSGRRYGVTAFHPDCRNAYRKARRPSAKERGVRV